ncbi:MULTISPECIES: alpha/beta hydrolase [unclassified Pseudomonas]|uniref:alpha/beta fold hydrolase n=1 Tax=unclassified Pseudomonas TaxID=196821 RepID=UPI0008390D6F|nr:MULTISPECIES: alpha/beta hydrolase [unclassified Pseudomonas]QIH08852.1 alpha/beta hydrolase [Pseudomonas sp. BIOMIG1BAC]
MPSVSTRQHWIDTPRGQLFAQCWNPGREQGVPLVLLHDSLGCVSLWRDFPERLALASGRRVVAYDRLGFGRSAARSDLPPTCFVEDEAQGDFQAVCHTLGIERFVVFGHSVGGGMAIGCAAAHPQGCEAVISESAQAFVEQRTRDGIRQAQRQFAEPGQLQRLHKYHGDKATWVLRAWTDTWLDAAFGHWTLDPQLARVQCPLLVLHGNCDEYGSLLHPERIAAGTGGPAWVHVFAGCGHVPHRENPHGVLEQVLGFLSR